MSKISDYERDELLELESEREKRGIFIFFDILFNKFVKLMNLNFFFLIFSLPYMALLFWFSPITKDVMANLVPILHTFGIQEQLMVDLMLRFMFMLLVTILWGTGPATAGIAYVLRNFSRREHAWVWADFIYSIRTNLKQSLVVMVIDLASIFLFNWLMRFYASILTGTVYVVFVVAMSLFLITYTFMHFYIYQLMVSYEDNLKTIYKNSFMFALLKWIPNLLILVGVAGVIVLMFYFLQLFALVPFVIIFTIVFALVVHFYTSRTIPRVVDKKE